MFAKYLSPYTPGNIWKESFLGPISKQSRKLPTSQSWSIIVSGTVKQTLSSPLTCCYSNSTNKQWNKQGVKVIKGRVVRLWGEVKGVSCQISPSTLQKYGAAMVRWRSGKLMVLSGLVRAWHSARFYPSR